jgi:transposase
MVPYDKFRPSNYEKALIYITVITLMDPARIKFGDEKHIEGNVLYCRKVRRDILTGIVPDIMTHPDFRQRYTIVGFCGIDPRVSPVRYGISVNTNDAANFSDQIVMAIHLCWLLPGDVLVLDNAAIHNGGDNSDLENWLWQNFRIYLIYLPARTPEWNPIELVWNILVQRLNVFCLSAAKQIGGKHSLVVATMIVLNAITHKEVRGCYRTCGYGVPK